MLKNIFGKQLPKPLSNEMRCGSIAKVQVVDFFQRYDQYYRYEQTMSRARWGFVAFCLVGSALGTYTAIKQNKDLSDEAKMLGGFVGFTHGALGSIVPPLGIYFTYKYFTVENYFKCVTSENSVVSWSVTSYKK